MLDRLPPELINQIIDYLEAKEVIAVLASCKTLWLYRTVLIYHCLVHEGRINHLSYSRRFRSLIWTRDYQCTNRDVADRIVSLTWKSDLLFYQYPRLKYLTFDDHFDRSIQDCIPASVTNLTFGYYFNQPIRGYIPASVTHLTFGVKFNQSIEGCIPASVRHLTFNDDFNQPIRGCIPPSVVHLTFGWYFNQPIEGCIPPSVSHLTFGYCFKQSIEGHIPASVSHLILKRDRQWSGLPPSLRYLKIGDKVLIDQS